jgi:phage shock protein PspC (stress-responsive transcriptional regulator)
MTETRTDPPAHPTAPYAYASPRLERPRESALKGVCSALARTTGTDVVLWRVLAVILSFFGGLGIFLYLFGIVVIPAEGDERSLGERLLRGPDRHLTGWQVVLVVLVLCGFVGMVRDTDGLLAAVVLAVLGMVWWHGRAEAASPSASPGSTPPGAAPPGAAPGSGAASFAPTELGQPSPYPMPPPRPVAPPRPRSPIGGLTASLAIVAAGALLLLGAAGAVSVPAEAVLATCLGIVGLGLVVGSRWGRSSGLIVLAALLGVGLAATVAVRPVLDAGVGERTWRPDGSASYRLGVGDATLDLRSVPVPEAGTTAIDAQVDVGHLLVLVPDGVRISLDARAELGDLLVLGVDTNGRDAAKHLDLGPEGAPQLRLDLRVRTGQVEVRRG